MSQTPLGGQTVIRVYIAAPYELRPVAMAARRAFVLAGVEVVARWLDAQAQDSDLEARKDLEDITADDTLVALNPSEWARLGTGGRHVELGFALALQKRIVLVGARTNVFHQHSDIHCVADIHGALAVVRQPAVAAPLEEQTA